LRQPDRARSASVEAGRRFPASSLAKRRVSQPALSARLFAKHCRLHMIPGPSLAGPGAVIPARPLSGGAQALRQK